MIRLASSPVVVAALFAVSVASLVTRIPSASGNNGSHRSGFSHSLSHRFAGGVLFLSAPSDSEVLFPRSVFVMGSFRADIRLVVEACRREPLGYQCESELFENELDAHRVSLSPYWIDRNEVTVAEYMRCAEAGSCSYPPYNRGAQRFSESSFPVSLVSWDDAVSYCAFVGKRLPSEAEWERAARGPSGRRFPWGNDYATRRANHGSWALDSTDDSDGYAELAPVGSFPHGSTPERVNDLAGNVAEWVRDNYADGYEAIPVDDPAGPQFGTHKVVRGGAYNHGMPWLRGAARMFRRASVRSPSIGFRCARGASLRRVSH